MAKARSDFTDILVEKGKLSTEQQKEAVSIAKDRNLPLLDAVVELGVVTIEEAMQALAEEFQLEYVELEEVEIPDSVIELVPESVARENEVIPLGIANGGLKVATAKPQDLSIVDKLRFILNQEVELALAPKESIIAAINRHYGQSQSESVDSLLQEFTETNVEFTDLEQAAGMEVDSEAPIVKLVNLMITEASSLRASDIHIEPFADRIRIRYRIDGVLVERDCPPRRLLSAILTRIKILGSIDITEKRRPQDGRIKFSANGKDLDIRVSILPSNHGQSVVMRLLDPESIKIGIRDLGFGEEDYRRFTKIIKRPNGIFLVTGPTGSGKTTTLYAALNELNRPDRKIITAEDPVEYYLPGVNQCEVKADIGLTFQAIIRAMLRQAPNIILVGEIRDKETADIAIQASLTGHLVFSTLHTNDAPSSITRLTDIGVQPFLVASSLMAVMAQRLVRVICPKCKQPYQPKPAELQAVGIDPKKLREPNFHKGAKCGHCHKTGYRGRLGIFELMEMTTSVREMTFRGKAHMYLRKQARQDGMRTLLQDGLLKAIKGITTIEEVVDVAGLSSK